MCSKNDVGGRYLRLLNNVADDAVSAGAEAKRAFDREAVSKIGFNPTTVGRPQHSRLPGLPKAAAGAVAPAILRPKMARGAQPGEMITLDDADDFENNEVLSLSSVRLPSTGLHIQRCNALND